MSEVREEYTRETYPSFGKKYNGERAVISLTSWKARISTCSKTIFSLLKQCPGFHIVLVLSEEEFPKMMDELPDNLKLFVDNELIEVLWTRLNLKPHKKYFYTMQKYKDIPIITTDDDVIYNDNFADILFASYIQNPNSIIANRCHLIKINKQKNEVYSYNTWIKETKIYTDDKLFFTGIGGVLYPPNCLKISENNLEEIKQTIYADDVYLNALCNRYKIKKINLCRKKYSSHDDNNGLCELNVDKKQNDRYINILKRDFLI